MALNNGGPQPLGKPPTGRRRGVRPRPDHRAAVADLVVPAARDLTSTS